MERLIKDDRSLIIGADVETILELNNLVMGMRSVPRVSGFKIGCSMNGHGLTRAVSQVRDLFGQVICISDPQKGGTDIPPMGPKFAKMMRSAGFDAVILFPFAGPVTQERWTKSCQDAGLRVIIGGIMTHEKFLVSEGGYISDNAPEEIFNLACAQGVHDFVVPGTKLGWVATLIGLLVSNLGEGNFDLYAPGFGSNTGQGGDIAKFAAVAGKSFHAIVGGEIYNKSVRSAMTAAAIEYSSQLELETL